MEIKVFHHGRSCHVDGLYSDGKVVVLKGSKIFTNCSNKFSKYNKVISLRKQQDVVNEEGVLLKDCYFKSPTAAAVFVKGSSRSGTDFWNVSKGVTLGAYLEEKGIRARRRRANNVQS